MQRFTLASKQRIKNSKEITTLIREGQAFFLTPYKVYYSSNLESKEPLRVAFAVPKRKFGKAVMRNRLKRLSRECFRLQKEKLESVTQSPAKPMSLLFVYQNTKVLNYSSLCKAMEDCITEIIRRNG
jgi:ribonuclease P protein component